MENLINNLGWKKLVAIIIVFSTLFLGVVLLPFFKPQNTGSRTNGNQSSESANQPTSFFPKATPATMLSYANTFFSIQYPQELSLTVGKIYQDGDSVTLKSSYKNQA